MTSYSPEAQYQNYLINYLQVQHGYPRKKKLIEQGEYHDTVIFSTLF